MELNKLPFPNFVANFSGMGGECEPTETAPLEGELARGGSRLARGVLGVRVIPARLGGHA